MPAPPSFAQWVSQHTAGTLRNCASGTPLVGVVGNQAADADSIVSAAALAFIRAMKSDRNYQPFVQCDEEDLSLRPEVGLLWSRFTQSPKVALPSTRSELPSTINSWVLVDHNELTIDAPNATVVGIVDHHVDAGKYPELEGGNRVIEPVGSCCTLVAREYLNEAPKELDAPLCGMLLGVILLDTVNMSPEAGKATAVDWDVVERLSSVVGYDSSRRAGLFEELQQAKTDPKMWEKMTSRQLVDYDFKAGREDHSLLHWVEYCKMTRVALGPFVPRFNLRYFNSGIGVAMSSLLAPLREVASKCVDNIRSRGHAAARLWVLMSCYTIEAGHICRELLVCVRDPEEDATLLSSVTTFLESREVLQLWRMDIDIPGAVAYHQGNVKASRKKVAPALCEFLQHAWLGIQEEEEEEVVSVDPPQTPHPQDPSGAAGVDRENGVSAPESPSRFSQGHLADDERPLSDDDDSASSWTMSSDEVVDSPGEAGPDEDPPRRSVVPPLRLDKLPTFEPEQPAPTPTPDPGVFGGLANTVVGWFNTQGDETLPEESDRSGLSEGESDDEGPGLRNLPGVGAAAVSGTEEGVVASSLDGGPEGEQHPEGVHSAGEGERYIGEAVVEEGPYSEEEGEGEAVVEEGPYSEEEGEGEEEEAVVEVPYIGEEPVSFITDDEVSEPNQHAESPLVDSPADAELPSMTHSEGEMNDSDGSETPSGATMIEWAPPSLASVGAAARESLQRLSVIMTGEGGPTLSESVSWTESSQGVEEGEVSGRSEATGFQTDGEKEDEQQQAGLHAEPSSDALGVPTVLEAHGPVMEPARQSGSVADDTLRLGQLVVEALHREDDQLSSSPISSEATDHGDAFENLTAVATRQEESQNAAATSSSEEAIGASVGVAESGQGYTEGEREFGEEEDEEIEALSTELQSTTARGDQATAATAVYGGLTDPEESLTEDAATMPLMGAAFSGDGQESKGGESTAAGALAEQQISNPESAVDVDGLSESLHSAGPMDSEQGECVEERVVETVMYSEAILLDEGQGEDVSEVEPDSMLEAGELQTAGTASPQHPAAMEEKPGRALDDGVEAVSSSTASRHSIPISTRLSDSPRLENEQTRLNTVDPDVKKHRLDTPFSHGELDEAMDPSRVTTEADRPVESLSPGDGRRVTAGNLSSRGEECSSKSERSLVDRDDQIRGSVVVEADVDRFEGISIPPSAAEEEVADAGVGSQGRRGSAEKLRESVLDTVYSRYANNNAAGMTAITTISDFCPDIRSAAEFDPDEYVRRIEDGPGPSPAERRLIRHAFLSGYDDALLAVERGELLENTDRVREEPSAAYVDLHPQTSAPLHNTVRSPSTPHRSTAEAPLLASQLNRSNDTTESELSFQLDDAPVCSSEKHDEGLAIGDSNSPSRPVTDQHLPASTIRDSSSRVALKSSFLEVPVTIPLSRRKFINGRPRHHKSRISCL